ncbi:MAG: hypothetical protein CVT99_11605 [Bacteroidetes bacterium HGW-Bacteroidetes-16]|nr:MAG: hypothetical protein CVT99_11605 [Bacteroidetes bacterium HGW-Bacteroidetes-16]
MFILALSVSLWAQSPHGDELKISCDDCHKTKGWTMEPGSYTFKHDSVGFPLLGQHQSIDCRMCHTTLVFSAAQPECVSCHTDMHNQTVGMECELCHTPKSWLVPNITQIHQMSRFPLLGAHATADCNACHPSVSNLSFEPLGIECIDCHQADYNATTSPNHVDGNFSTNCVECHYMNVFSWSGAGIDHSFFPLTQGHSIGDCFQCHTQGSDYSNISAECFSCHEPDYQATTNPSHVNIGISTECLECHTTAPGWKPAEFGSHDAEFFPIYSGKHNGEWDNCTDCHQNTANYAMFTCIDCHEHNKSDTDQEHDDVSGYLYESQACLDCHPTGDGEGSFNHNTSDFPLTGAHSSTECKECHVNGYAGTSTICYDCHTDDFNQTVNPNHIEIGVNTECDLCHTTDPEWKPAEFPVHDDYYALTGAHGRIATDCFSCHEGSYVNTPNLCLGCHTTDYNETSNPPHAAAQFSTECETCHNTEAWQPATFNHDAEYFPIYSGEHEGEWNTCIECHTNPSNYALFSCIDCHDHNKIDTDEEHGGISGYQYNSDACFACHPTGSAEGGFNHNNTNFPLTGAHNTVECSICHVTGYTGTSTVCVDCHLEAFNQSANPDHQTVGISTDCQLCHTTNPGWSPATFSTHGDYYPLTGAHTSISNDCSACHQGNYNNTPNACVGCHQVNYNQTTNPNHTSLALSTGCDECHTTNPGWNPATFGIHNQYYVLAGAHISIANQCVECHNGNYNSTPNTCYGCHQDDYDQTTDPAHAAANFPTECESCHTQSAWLPSTFNHDGQYFPIYSGKHNGEWNSCVECHTNPSNYSVFSCIDCHEHNQTDMADEHQGVSGYQYNSDACYACHPDGSADNVFNHNTSNFPLTGAHNTVACSACHESGYAGTSTICVDCHVENYNQTSNPNHLAIGISTDCELCHTTNPGWSPATFPTHGNYYPLTGAHTSIANDCSSCHQGNYNNTPNACAGCHQDDYNQTTNPNHVSLALSTLCDECHTTNPGWNPATFPIHANYYPLTGAHTSIANDCSSCHQGNYNNTPNTCVGCHQDDYNQTTNPNHVSLALSTVCDECHTTNPGWNPALFPDHDQYYLLVGAHIAIADQCADCHNGNYNSTPNTCYGCHQDDYNQTTDPAHAAAQYPTDCETCHTQTAWVPSTFNHDSQYFPIYSGEHDGEWNTCSDCHPNPANYTIFTCITCHEQSDMADEHQGVSGYIYNSDACYNCHPNGTSSKQFQKILIY